MIFDFNLRVGTNVSAMNVIERGIAMPYFLMTGDPRHIIGKNSIVLRKPFGAAHLTKAPEGVTWQIAPAAPVSAPLSP